MLLSVMPASALALENEVDTVYGRTKLPDVEPGYLVNSLHGDKTDPQDFLPEGVTLAVPEPLASTDSYVSVETAASQLRAGMVSHRSSVTVNVRSTNSNYSDVAVNVFHTALEHTGNPKEGDYLGWQWDGLRYSTSRTYSGGYYYYDFTYYIEYYTTAAQETEMDRVFQNLMNSLDLSDEDEYHKVKGIYDWICANVTYDYENLYDNSYGLKYTAYAALVNRTAVCQGYALLLYRMALTLGIDCRLIASVDHGYNIVKLGDLYYYLDSTWDAGLAPSRYNYFLRNEDNFEDCRSHIRIDCSDYYGEDYDYTSAAFYARYPMSPVDYTYTPHTHSYRAVVTDPTCTERGYTTYTCSCGESYVSNYVNALGHDWRDATCTEPETCYRCDVTRGDPLGHNYEDGTCTHCGEEDPDWEEPDEPDEPEDPAEPEEPFEGEGFYRFAGEDRYATAIAVADQLKINLGVQKFQNVVVAYGQNFPDALSGSYLAYLKDAPILLTQPSVEGRMVDYIKNNLVRGGTAYLLGDRGVVPGSFEDALRDLGFRVVRLAGPTRYETNMAILREAGIGQEQPVLIATGKNYADSLSASATGLPILLVDKKLTDAQKVFLRETSGEFVILGGYSAVSEQVEAELDAMGSVIRIQGANRYVTSVLIARIYFPNTTAAVLAYAQGFPDGLCGGPLALSMGAPLILTTNESYWDADNLLENITYGAVTGGDDRISDRTVRDIFDLPWYTPIICP